MITFKLSIDQYNSIKFKKHHDQLRLLRHDYSNYDVLINSKNWKSVTVQFVKAIAVHFPKLKNSAQQWGEYKLTNYMR